MNEFPVCTCTDNKCPFNPVNHEHGCDLCIAKNLKNREIPGCFFRLASSDLTGHKDWTFEGFAKLVLKKAEG